MIETAPEFDTSDITRHSRQRGPVRTAKLSHGSSLSMGPSRFRLRGHTFLQNFVMKACPIHRMSGFSVDRGIRSSRGSLPAPANEKLLDELRNC